MPLTNGIRIISVLPFSSQTTFFDSSDLWFLLAKKTKARSFRLWRNLYDIQMPQMDGYALMRKIRQILDDRPAGRFQRSLWQPML
ncbi:hypothetical protein QUB33_22720 [Microcoleus sp. B3-A4]|uniref:hypothetical protein n=1 Tax=Microcoleus sp. B3-A4 TaxID=2818653 RepID=UPI002FD5BEA0